MISNTTKKIKFKLFFAAILILSNAIEPIIIIIFIGNPIFQIKFIFLNKKKEIFFNIYI